MYRIPHGQVGYPTGEAAGVAAGLRQRDRNLGTFLLGWGWIAWGQIYSRARVGPARAWVDFPCFCLHRDSALWLHLSPWQVGRPQGAHLSFGGGQGNLGSGLALRTWTWQARQNTLSKQDNQNVLFAVNTYEK